MGDTYRLAVSQPNFLGSLAGSMMPLSWVTRTQQQLTWATVATIDMGLKEGVLCPFAQRWEAV